MADDIINIMTHMCESVIYYSLVLNIETVILVFFMDCLLI